MKILIAHRQTSLVACIGLMSMLTLGCSSLRSPWGNDSKLTAGPPTSSGSWLSKLPFSSRGDEPPAQSPASQVATAGGVDEPPLEERSLTDRLAGTNKLVGFVTGKGSDKSKAQQLYQKGDALFRKAENLPKGQREKMFSQAADFFGDAGDANVGSAIHQDALFMRGEALFFANELNGARDAFETLQKDFPRNRHSDRVAARLFSISKYWIETNKAGADSWYKVNLFDKKRPFLDSAGHAVKVLDQIRYDDPTGKLADDATMAAAAEHIRNGKFEEADEFLTDLRLTFTDSDHLFLAHLLGIQCKLEIYAGPKYSERVLDEAGKLVKQTRRRFPDRLREDKYNEMVARAAATIEYHKAEKLSYRAKIRERQGENKAAAEIYRTILRDHPSTPQAEEARKVVGQLEKRPAKPSKPLSSLTRIFPDSKVKTPLKMVSPNVGQPMGDGQTAIAESERKTSLR